MSSKNLIWTVIILTLLFIGSAISASALQEDFNAYSAKETINACACDLVQDSLFVQNAGQITSTYFLQKGGEAADWSTHAPDAFYLEQGERKEIKNFVNVPCYARGDYELTTKVKTLFDLEKTLTQTVHVDNCANVQLVQKSFTQETCPCSPVTYEFEITNTGQHTESYRINVTPFDDSASVSDPILVLEPGQSHTVYAFLSLPCDINGQQEFTLNALAEGTGILGELDFNLMIDSCYDFRLEPEDEYNICANVPNAVTVPITNIVDIANRYTLSVEGPMWAYVQNETAFAWGKQQTAATLMVTSSAAISNLYASSRLTGVSVNALLLITLNSGMVPTTLISCGSSLTSIGISAVTNTSFVCPDCSVNSCSEFKYAHSGPKVSTKYVASLVPEFSRRTP